MKQNEQKAVAFGKLLATLGRPEACFRTLYIDDADAAEYLSLLFHGAAALFDGTQDAEIPALRKWYRAAIKCGKGEGALTEADFRLAASLCYHAEQGCSLFLLLTDGDAALPYTDCLAPDFLLSVRGALSDRFLSDKTEHLFLLRGRTDKFGEALEYSAFLSGIPICFADQRRATVKTRTSIGIALSYGGRLYHLPNEEMIPAFITAMEAAEYLSKEYPLLRENVSRHHKTERAVFERIL